MNDRAAALYLAVASSVSVGRPPVIKTQTSETPKRAWRSTRPNLHTLTTTSFQSLPSIISASFPPTTVPTFRIALAALFFSQGSGNGIDPASCTVHLSSNSFTPLPGIAATSIAKKAHAFLHCLRASTFFCIELPMITSCDIPRKSRC